MYGVKSGGARFAHPTHYRQTLDDHKFAQAHQLRKMTADPPAATQGVAAPAAPLLIMTHHKCASTFVFHYMGKVCDLNGLLLFASHLGTAQPRPDYQVSLLTNAVYYRIKDAIRQPAIHIIRNPLDLVVSAYYSHLSTHSAEHWPQLRHQRNILQNCSKEAGFFLTLAFLEQEEFYPQTPGSLHALRAWRLDDPRVRTLRMEDLVLDVESVLGGMVMETLGDALQLPRSEDFSFERITGGRRPGEIDESSHYRSGLPDTWRRELPDPIIAYIRAHFHAFLDRYYPHALG